MSGEVDQLMAGELFEEIRNDGMVYHQRTEPIIKNLHRKHEKGVYDSQKAVKLWRYLVDDYARRYAKEHGLDSRLINGATRESVAKELRDYYHDEVIGTSGLRKE